MFSKKFLSLSVLAALVCSIAPPVQAQVAPMIIDDGNVGFATTGSWQNYAQGYQGDQRYAMNQSTATWTFANLQPGKYRVSVTYKENPVMDTKASYTVSDGSVVLNATPVTVNHRLAPSSFTDAGIKWQTLGEFSEYRGSIKVKVTSGTANKYFWADAVRIDLLEAYSQDTALLDGTPSYSGGEGEGSGTTTVEALVLYTPEAVSVFGSVAALQAATRKTVDCDPATDTTCQIAGGIELSTNGIFAGSRSNVRIAIAGFAAAPFNDAGHDLEVTLLSATSNTQVQALRNSYKADVVILIVGNSNVLSERGISFVPASIPNGGSLATLQVTDPAVEIMSNNAFISVVKASLNNEFLIAITHELGHTLGDNHEVTADPAGLEPWSHGFVSQNNFKTIESGPVNCGTTCRRIQLFSNATISWLPTGTTTPIPVGNTTNANGVVTMNKMLPFVSVYRTNFTNRANCLDVDGDGTVAPIDSLRIINFLNTEYANGYPGDVANFPDPRRIFSTYGALDTNHDNNVSPIDSLRIINYLNNPTDPQFSPATVCVAQ